MSPSAWSPSYGGSTVLPSQTGIENPAPRRTPRPARAATPIGTAAELGVGVLLLGGAAVAGLLFVRRPWPNRLDAWGSRVLPANLHAQWAHAFVALGSLTALLLGVLGVFVIGILGDRVRAVAGAAAPVLAVLIVQDIAKPLVDRHTLSGGLSYPSGTVAAVAALATAFTLVVPRRARFPVGLLGCLATAGTGAAVIVLQWHYATDALGGAAVGIGSVLVVDALLHLPRILLGFLRGRPAARVHAPATMGGDPIVTLARGTGRATSYGTSGGAVGHAQVHHHGNPREWERDPGQVAGR
jgi:membrane-associated phospholipid phosphatase